MTQIIEFEGTRHEFPDDFTSQEISSALSSSSTPPAAQPTGNKGAFGPEYMPLRVLAKGLPAAALGLPALLMDASDSIVNLGKRGYNALNDASGIGLPPANIGPNFRYGGALTQSGNLLADKLAPPPASKMGQGLEEIGSAGVSALGGAGIAGAMARSLAGSPNLMAKLPVFLQELANSPKAQTTGAMGSVAATEAAREADVKDPRALMALSLAGGTLGGVRTGGVATRLPAAAAQPFSQAGRGIIVGDLFNRLSQTPSATAERLANAREIVPGSSPMVSQVSQDPGLIRSENALRGLDQTGQIEQRYGEQNQARMAELNRITRDEPTLNQATKKRDSTYEEFAQPAFALRTVVDASPIYDTINDIRKSYPGVKVAVKSAMDEVQSRVDGLMNSDIHNPQDPRNLYALRQDLMDLRDGKYNNDKSDYRLAKGEIQEVIKHLDTIIESGAPGYKDYMSLYAKRSIPLDQLKALQELRQRAVMNISDPVTGEPVIGSKFTGLLARNLDNGLNLRGRGVGDGKLSQSQLSTLDRVASDLDRGSAVSASTMRPAGSDTFKNLSVANVIGNIVGKDNGAEVAQSVAGRTLSEGKFNPLAWMYHMPDEAMQQLILSAWKDPKLAAQFMKKANDATIRSVGDELKERAAKQFAAQAIYAQGKE